MRVAVMSLCRLLLVPADGADVVDLAGCIAPDQPSVAVLRALTVTDVMDQVGRTVASGSEDEL